MRMFAWYVENAEIERERERERGEERGGGGGVARP